MQRIYLSGGSSRVPPLLPAIEARARVPVELMDPFRNVQHAAGIDAGFLRQHGIQGVVALGLALRSQG
ncbi:MAG: pilus assembly protein PilM, partial [Actinomycetota bacterium]